MKFIKPLFLSILFAASLLSVAPPTLATDDPVLFEMNGKPYPAAKLSEGGRRGLYGLEARYYRGLQSLIDKELLARYFQEEAKRLGKSVEQVRAERLAVMEPTEQAIRASYEERKDRVKKPYEEMRDRFADYLTKQAVREKEAALVAEYREKNSVKLRMAEPIAPVVKIDTEDAPVKGAPGAKVTIVKFADYLCDYCKKAGEAIKKVMKRFGDKVKVVYMDFPRVDSDSRAIAEGGVCAAKQGKFWAYHDMAYEKQRSLTAENLTKMAEGIDLDEKAFAACRKSKDTAARVRRMENEAERLHLSVPTLFVNGRQYFETDFTKAVEVMEADLARAVEAALSE